jgi:hypothetical protein
VRNIYRRDAEAESIFRRGVNKNGESGICSLCVSASLRLILLCVLFVASCSVPNLEQPECDQARDRVKEFYSYHFGYNLGFTEENLNARRDYLTPEFLARLQGPLRDAPAGADPFTWTGGLSSPDDAPKAFRAGECKVLLPDKLTEIEVLLFWKDDVRSEQRSIWVELEKQDGKWLINHVRTRGSIVPLKVK